MSQVVLNGGDMTVPGTLNVTGSFVAENGTFRFNSYASVLCADKGQCYGGYVCGNGAWNSATYRIQHTAACDVVAVQLVYHNHNANTGDSITAAGPVDLVPITVKASIDVGPYTGGIGTIYPVYFGGSLSVIIPPGGDVVSDVVFVPISEGDTFYTRTCVASGTAGRWPTGITCDSTLTEGVKSNADYTQSGAVVGVAEKAYSPSAIVGWTVEDARAGVAFLGSSSAAGNNDYLEPGDQYGGYVVRALKAAKIGFVPLARAGTASVDATTGALAMRIRMARFAQQAILCWQTNDITAGKSLSQIQGYLQSAVALCRAQGCSKVFVNTISPITTSTDSWATLANQTVTAHEDVRLAVNAWLRSAAALLIFDGVFDTAATIESGGAASPSGKWIVTGAANYATADGTHPSTAAHQLMATAITGQGLGELTPIRIPPDLNSRLAHISVPLAANDEAAALLGVAVGEIYADSDTNAVMRRAS